MTHVPSAPGVPQSSQGPPHGFDEEDERITVTFNTGESGNEVVVETDGGRVLFIAESQEAFVRKVAEHYQRLQRVEEENEQMRGLLKELKKDFCFIHQEVDGNGNLYEADRQARDAVKDIDTLLADLESTGEDDG